MFYFPFYGFMWIGTGSTVDSILALKAALQGLNGRQWLFISDASMADMEDENSRQSANPSDDQYILNAQINDESEYMGDNINEDSKHDDHRNAGIYEIEDRTINEEADSNPETSRDYFGATEGTGDNDDVKKEADGEGDERGEGYEEKGVEGEGGDEDEDDDDDDESDDDVKITIGDITANPATYTSSFNLKRGAPGQNNQGTGEKSKFTTEEFDGSMAINGVPAHEFSLDSLEEKPWRKPGADITDYFNYGFNEMTWQSYCDRQRRLRMESGAGIPASLGLGPPPKVFPLPVIPVAPVPIPISVVNENSKYAGSVAVKKAGPPPARKMAGAIDVIGGGNLSSRRPESGVSPPATNLEETPVVEKASVSAPDFSRPPPGFPNMALPPPFVPPPALPPPLLAIPPPLIVPDPYGGDFMAGPGAPGDDYYQYEPTQDSQWAPTDWRGGPPMGVPPPLGSINLGSKGRRESSHGTPPVPGMDDPR
nr:EOG090X0BVA [Sida crystallina]